MKKILLFLLVLFTVQSFGQDSYKGDSKIGEFIFYRYYFGVPTNYQYRVVRERSIAAMFDSSLHVPRYNGTPVGLRTGSSTNDGLIAIDTVNNILYFYSSGGWITSGNTYTASLPIRVTGTVISADTSVAYNPSLTTNARLQKIADSLASLASGTINSGTAGKPAYYVGATTLDDFIAVDYATSGTNVKITTQATTDVGLEIKAQSSQSANLLNISSSGGTGDLVSIASNGRAYFANQLGIGAASSAPLSIKADITASYGQLSIAPASGTGNAAIVYESYYDAVGTRLMVMGLGHYAGGTDPLYYFANEISGGGVAFRNGVGTTFQVLNTGAAKLNYYGVGTFTGTPAKYPAFEADGDIIEVTASSLKPALNKGAFLSAPTSADVLDMYQTPVAITVSSVKAILRGSSPSVTYNIRFGTDITSATDVFTADITCTSITTGCSNNSGFNDATIPAGSFIWIVTTAASGTINSISFTFNYTED